MYDHLFLYIDPGTGSMLFSILIGLVTAGYFLLKALWIKLRFSFSGKGAAKGAEAKKHGIVIYSEGNQYWNVFSPILRELESRGVRADYWTSAKDDPAFKAEWKSVRAEYIGEGNKAFARLNFLEADVCLMTTPGLDVYQLKRSRLTGCYAHVLHAVDDATSYRLFGLDYFDAVLLSGEYQKASIHALEKKRDLNEKELLVVGCPYLDLALERLGAQNAKDGPDAALPQDALTVLVSPSWGPGALLSRYGEQLLDPLVSTGFRIIVRPHPQSKKSEAAMLERLQARYAGDSSVEWDFERDNLGSMARTDVMISDFSGIIFDFAFLFDKPFLYALQDFNDQIYDSSDLEEKPWKFRSIEEMGTKLDEAMFPSIGSVLASLSKDERLSAKRREARDEAWQRRGESARLIADFLVSKTT